MKVVSINELPDDRKIQFHSGISNRILLEKDNMGFTLTKTIIEPGKRVFQHYKHHLESCYCVKGDAILINALTGEEFKIIPDITYILDNNDPHYFEAYEETVLICVFNPPLKGQEIHKEDGSYTI